MRILHVLFNGTVPDRPDVDPSSGIVQACLQIAREQVKAGHRVSVYFPSRPARRWEWEGVQMLGTPNWPWARLRVKSRVLDFSSYGPLLLTSWRSRYDVVHAHGFGYLRGIHAQGVVQHFHADPQWAGFTARDYRRVAHDVRAIVTVNHAIAETLRATESPLPPVFPVPIGVRRPDGARDPSERQRSRRALGLDQGAFVLLFVGAVVPDKGVAELLSAFSALEPSNDGPFLLIAGSSSLWRSESRDETPYEQRCREFIRNTGLLPRVRWLGLLDRPRLVQAYAGADALVVPSQWPEAACLAALEGLSLGIPVVATAVGGVPEYLRNAAWLVAPDPLSLADGLERVRHDGALRESLAQAGLKVVGERTWPMTVAQLEDVYAHMLT